MHIKTFLHFCLSKNYWRQKRLETLAPFAQLTEQAGETHCANLKGRSLIYITVLRLQMIHFHTTVWCSVGRSSFEPIACCHTPPVLANCLQLFLYKLLLGKLATHFFNFLVGSAFFLGPHSLWHATCFWAVSAIQLNFGLPKERPGVLLREWTCLINWSLWVFWCFINPPWISDISGLPLSSFSFSPSLKCLAFCVII